MIPSIALSLLLMAGACAAEVQLYEVPLGEGSAPHGVIQGPAGADPYPVG
ncbi:hypothetical protein [Marinobacterium aestuariivivens]|uniref:Uncharacterized protein n=1 Tax=Marinobacterium aestuariivivens TaxID=1698799 RepID=A0ABW2A3Q1_9GAMM